jgi:protein tyrosine phosphatase
MNVTYQLYCIGSVLYNKSINYITNDTADNKQPKRICNMNRGVFGGLYDLTYESTKIVDQLYLGNSYNARNYYDLEQKDIGLIINSSPGIPNYFEGNFEYYNVNVKDISGANILIHLHKTIDIMHSFITNNPTKNILVHCFMGSSRSATIIIAYLIKYNEFRLRDALNYLKQKRNVVNLNIDFFDQLKLFENDLKNNKQE